MAAFKPAYLIYGNDHARIGERRARLRAIAEQTSGVGGVELIEGEEATPEAVAAALCAMTFAIGRRFVIVEGAERWREADVECHLTPVLAAMTPETTVAFFAREEGRAKAPAKLHDAVRRAGGDISEEAAIKEWDLPKWAQAHARSLGIELDAAAGRALVAQVGVRQQRLARELERLAIGCGPGARLDAEQIAELAAGSAERRIWTIADALVARDAPAGERLYLRLRAQGERVESISYWLTKRVREALGVAVALDAGAAPAEIKKTLRMPPRAADRFITDVRRSDVPHLRTALARLADLERDSRGASELDADTLALATIEAIAA